MPWLPCQPSGKDIQPYSEAQIDVPASPWASMISRQSTARGKFVRAGSISGSRGPVNRP